MKIAVVTSNKHKLEELSNFLENEGFSFIQVNPKETDSPQETGSTFLDNARIKSRHYSKILGIPVISDDSGLMVDSLYGLPGLFSARYSGLGDAINNQKLLKSLEGKEIRDARFISIISIAFPDGKTFDYEGIFKGSIAEAPSGNEGFGYDPIFIPKGEDQTLASLGSIYKSKNSHRVLALQKLVEGKDEIINYWRFTWQK